LDHDWTAAQVMNSGGQGSVLLVCEHASSFIPDDLDGLGASADARRSHAAWDIGALDVATALSQLLDAPLVAGAISRLVYDCNRPLSAPDCIPVRSEIYEIPGNADLGEADKQARFDRVHTPFHDTVANQSGMANPAILVTIHSFAPIFNGIAREVELGFLYHNDPAPAQALLAQEQKQGVFRSALNEPYAAKDGVTYTLDKHGEARRVPAVMIEIRNDLIDTGEKAQAMAQHLSVSINAAFPDIRQKATR